MKRTILFRHLLPIMLLALTLGIASAEFFVVSHEHRHAALMELETLFHHSGSMLAQDLTDRAAEGRRESSLRVLARSASLPHRRYAAFVDDGDRIEQSTDAGMIGLSLGALQPSLPAHRVAAVRESEAGQVWRDESRHALWAIYPVRLPAIGAETGVARTALVLILGDLSSVYEEGLWNAARHSLMVLAWALLASIAMGLLLKRLLLDRMTDLLAYTEFPYGSASATRSPPVSGSDELGQMGSRFHSLLQQVVSGREELAHLLDCLPIPVWKTDREGRCVYVNRAWLEFTGRSREQEMGASWDRGWHPDDRERCLSTLRAALASGTGCNLDYRMRYRDGSYRWIRDQGEPFHGREGALRGYIRACYDIQTIRNSHAALTESEARFRGLVENSPVGVYLLHERRLVYGNPRMAALLGCRPEEIANIVIDDLIHPDDAWKVGSKLGRLEAGEITFARHEFRARRRHGRYGWVAVFGSRIDYEDGHAIIGMVIDITERKRAEDTIRKSAENLRVTLRSIADAVIATDPRGRVTLINPVAETLTGWREEDATGQPLSRVLHLVDAETGLPVQSAVVGGVDARPGGPRDTFLIAADGSRRPVTHQASPIRPMPDGQVTGAVWVLRDETERHELITALRDNERRYRELFEVNPHPMWVYDREFLVFLAVNDAALAHYGYSRKEFLAMSILDLGQAEAREFPGETEVQRHRCKNGRVIEVEVAAHAFEFSGRPACVVLAHDVTERKQAEERLRLAGTVFEAAREAIVVTDAERRIIAVNPAFTVMTGYTQNEVLGQDARILRSERHADEFYAALWQTIEREGVWRGEIWNRRRTDEVCPAMQTIVAVRDASGTLINYVSVATDITPLKQAEERVRRLAYYDALTGLPNRQLLSERARFALAIETNQHLQRAILFLDLDRFKYVNDSLGHQEGDTLLREVALRLRGIVSDTDTLSRLGGDEFVLLLSDVGREGAIEMAENVMSILDRPFMIAGHSFSLTVSIGISLYPHDGSDFETLLRNADTAMYRAKQTGRNTFLFYDTEMNVATLEYLKLMSALRRGVQVGELRTYFQPKVRLSDGCLVGTEALVRWIHPEEGLLMPGRFINAAERTDLIVSIGNWVLEDVCQQLASWRDSGFPPLTVAVNLAPRHFSQPGLADRLQELLQKYQLDPRCLELELTESTLLEPGEETLFTLEKLKRQGVNLAIDDFGVGYSSLSYLKHLPLASLKIDRSFVRDLTTDSDDRTIAATVVALGHSLGLKVVAEGVESEQQRDILLEQGCDFAQGYLYSRPLSSGDFTDWWRTRIGKVM